MNFKLLLTIAFLLTGTAIADDSVSTRFKHKEAPGYHIFVSDNDIDAAAYELVTELDTTYAQIATANTIEIVSADNTDNTQTVTIQGIDDRGRKRSESLVASGTTAVAGTQTFKYIDQASIDAEAAGIVTIRQGPDDTFITSIPAGRLNAQMAQHFNGKSYSYIKSWRANAATTTSVQFDLRVYDDEADSLDSGDGFRVIDTITTSATLAQEPPVEFSTPVKVAPNAWIAIFAKGASNDAVGEAFFEGFDSSL